MNDRRGFSLVELLVVSVLGSLLLIATYQVLVTNQQTYRENTEQVKNQQMGRMGLDLLTSELREIRTSDIVGFTGTYIQYATMTDVGMVCAIDYGPPVELEVVEYLGEFATNDSVVVFADNDSDRTSDDVWIRAKATAVDSVTCSSQSGSVLTFTNQATLFTDDTVRTGGPVRGLSTVTYQQGFLSGGSGPRYIKRNGTAIVGPVSTGTIFEYFKADGTTATAVADIHSIRITVHTEDGSTYSSTVYPRN